MANLCSGGLFVEKLYPKMRFSVKIVSKADEVNEKWEI